MTEYEINGKEYEVDYDLDNRIIKVDVDNDDVKFRYDTLGCRVIRQEGTAKTALIWWGDSECAEHKHQAGQTVIQNDIMAHPSRLNSVIARAVDGSKFKLEWYHKNYLDHVYAVSDDSGDILEHYRYTAFGEVSIYNATGVQQATSQINNQILWNTRRRDELTGFYMYKFRHYTAELGRWLSRDPIQEYGGVNLYGFVGNDGINRWDAYGMVAVYGSIHEVYQRSRQFQTKNIQGDWKFKVGINATTRIESVGGEKYSTLGQVNKNHNIYGLANSFDSDALENTINNAEVDVAWWKKAGDPARVGLFKRIRGKHDDGNSYCIQCAVMKLDIAFDTFEGTDYNSWVAGFALDKIIPFIGIDVIGKPGKPGKPKDEVIVALPISGLLDIANHELKARRKGIFNLVICADGRTSAGMYGFPSGSKIFHTGRTRHDYDLKRIWAESSHTSKFMGTDGIFYSEN